MNSLMLKKPEILIADDNPEYIRIIQAILEGKRCFVRSVNSGGELFKALARGLPDLILLDVAMNGDDDFEVCRKLKGDERYFAIPIIIFSARGDSDSIIKGFEAGAQDYVLKPVNPEELVARIETNVKLKLRTEKLQEMNREMESFNHMVSHDLKSPIWSIYKLTEFLGDRGNSEDAEEVVANIREKAQEAVSLIEKYSELARLSRTSFLFEKVDLRELVREVYGELSSLYENHRVEFSEEGMPMIYGDRLFLKQLFANILSNALKFSKNRDPARISVCCKRLGGDYLISVQDNGVGFNMKYAGDIFNMFTRLHSAREFDGSGTGLAISKKIISLHGGKAWISAKEGKGATFFFTVPADISTKGERKLPQGQS